MLKKIVSIVTVIALLAIPNPLINTAHAAERSSLIESRAVDLDQELNLPIGGSFIYEFNVGADPDSRHDTFGIWFNNMSGKYKYIVLVVMDNNVQSLQYESPELTKDDARSYLWAGGIPQTYIFRLIVINTGYTTLTGSIRIPPSYNTGMEW